jgi:PAS domain S-box-containing protein
MGIFLSDGPGAPVARRLLLLGAAIMLVAAGLIVAFRPEAWIRSGLDGVALLVVAAITWTWLVLTMALQIDRLAVDYASLERKLADAMAPMVFTLGSDGRLIHSNRRWLEYVGASTAGAQPLVDAQVVHPDDLADTASAWRDSVTRGSILEAQLRLKDRAGRYHWHLMRVVPDRDESGRVTSWIGTASAIDEERVEERRTEKFLAMLAHELRNPLAPIMSGLRVIQRRSLNDPELSACCSAIARQAHHLTRIVDDLLDVSRGSFGKLTLRKSPVKLADAIGTAVEATRNAFTERHQRLESLVPDASSWIDGDEVRLAQIVANLLDNAAKFSPDGARVRLQVIPHPGTVDIVVTDWGVGIGRDLVPRVFEAFSQASREPDRLTAGLGIGLNLVQTLVQLHGGTVTADSEGLGKGSSFTVRLPTIMHTSDETTPTMMDKVVAGVRVLIVDDNADASFTLATLLRLEGHDVSVAVEGSQALKLGSEFKPHVVLLDIGLPGMDGYEIARRLREDPSTSSSVIIALTGYGHAEARAQSKEAGFDQHMVKPVDPSALINSIALLESGVRPGAPGSVARHMLSRQADRR